MDLLTCACDIATYHQSVLECAVDVLNLKFPRLKRPKFESHSCDEATCRICSPLSRDTLVKLRQYATLMYRLMTENPACGPNFAPNEHTPHFNSGTWLLDHELALEAVDTPVRAGNTVGWRERRQRLQVLAQLCDAHHTPELLEMAKVYRADVESIAPDAPRAAVETQEEATADLARIRTILTRRWGELRDSQLDRAAMDQLLYCATVFGAGVDDAFAPLRTDWWRASYLPNQTVPGINKPGNLIEITEDSVRLRVPVCSKEPSNSADIDVTRDSPLLAEMLRAYRPIALEHNDGLLFIPGSLSARKKRRPRAMMALLAAGDCPHAGQCTRCHEALAACACKRPRPECGSYCGAACGHYTNIAGRHKRVCTALGNVQEREQLAASMGTSRRQLENYGSGSGSVGTV